MVTINSQPIVKNCILTALINLLQTKSQILISLSISLYIYIYTYLPSYLTNLSPEDYLVMIATRKSDFVKMDVMCSFLFFGSEKETPVNSFLKNNIHDQTHTKSLKAVALINLYH